MKKTIGIIASLLALASVLCIFSSCGKKIAMSYDGIEFKEAIYGYWYTNLKSRYVENYGLSDTEEFWNTKIDENEEGTYGDWLDNTIKTQISFYMVAQSIFKKNNLTLPQATVDSIESDINDLLERYGSRSELSSELKEVGLTISDLRDIYTMESKFLYVYSYFYDDNTGKNKATAEEIDAFYKANYAHVKYYVILKTVDYVYDENGKRVLDSATNTYKTENLSEADIAAVPQYAADVLAAVKSGEKTLDSYIKMYYPELDYPNGYYVTTDDYDNHTTTVISTLFNMEENTFTLAENNDAFFVIQKLPLEEEAYNGVESAQFSTLKSRVNASKFESLITSEFENITYNQDVDAIYNPIDV